jgi:hypothetical protein
MQWPGQSIKNLEINGELRNNLVMKKTRGISRIHEGDRLSHLLAIGVLPTISRSEMYT